MQIINELEGAHVAHIVEVWVILILMEQVLEYLNPQYSKISGSIIDVGRWRHYGCF